MLFKTAVLLAAKVNLLMKGVAPAVWPVMVIVVSSAWLAEARWEKTMKTAPTIINEHVFIRRLFFYVTFFEKSARACQRRPVRVQQKLQWDANLFFRDSRTQTRSEIMAGTNL